MKNKMIKPIFFLGLLCIVFASSCKKKIDEAYLNPNAPLVVPIESILPGVIGGFTAFFSSNGTGYGVQADVNYVRNPRRSPVEPKLEFCTEEETRSTMQTSSPAYALTCSRWQARSSVAARNFSPYAVSRTHSLRRLQGVPVDVYRPRPPRAACSLHLRSGIPVRWKGPRAEAWRPRKP